MIQIKRKYKRIVFSLVLLFAFVNVHAVFEGRNTKPNDLPSVRDKIEFPVENQAQKATGLGGSGGGGGTEKEVEDDMPISDSPLFFLLLGGAAYGVYVIRKRKVKTA